MKNDFETLSPLIDRYSSFLLDAYGVFWGGNGVGLFPSAAELMKTLVVQGKIVGILSNSTQLVAAEENKFQSHGLIKNEHFHFVITSGEIARNQMLQEKLPFEAKRKSYYVLGGIHPHFPKALNLFNDTGYTMVSSLEDADFIYISVPHINGEDVTDPELFVDQVRSVHHANLPMVCANPDLFAHEGNPAKAVVRQGSLAKLYEKLGGTVYYIGKPYPEVYAAAFLSFSQHNIYSNSPILMVGDTPETDIRGGNRAGLHTALITDTGIFAERCHAEGNKTVPLKDYDVPNYYVNRFCL